MSTSPAWREGFLQLQLHLRWRRAPFWVTVSPVHNDTREKWQTQQQRWGLSFKFWSSLLCLSLFTVQRLEQLLHAFCPGFITAAFNVRAAGSWLHRITWNQISRLRCYVFLLQGWQTFSAKNQMVNILGFLRPHVTFAAYSICFPLKDYFNLTSGTKTDSQNHCLPTPVLEYIICLQIYKNACKRQVAVWVMLYITLTNS